MEVIKLILSLDRAVCGSGRGNVSSVEAVNIVIVDNAPRTTINVVIVDNVPRITCL